ncbi:autotransporter-associated beta strand repeat-containing protein [Prosthecobacter sp.]|uniref:autotransporter-associated beta strand repeat-containing protein n=1 Tax=Prosthecobacter sp. TaxID=1965333 RepID=UPI003783B017
MNPTHPLHRPPSYGRGRAACPQAAATQRPTFEGGHPPGHEPTHPFPQSGQRANIPNPPKPAPASPDCGALAPLSPHPTLSPTPSSSCSNSSSTPTPRHLPAPRAIPSPSANSHFSVHSSQFSVPQRPARPPTSASPRPSVIQHPATSIQHLLSLLATLAFTLHPSSFILSAEPPRQELWVPTNQLDTVLRSHPNAVLLSPEQYSTLVRDAGKTKPEDNPDPRLAPPKLIAIESLRLDGTVAPGAATVTLRGELSLQLPSKDWLSTQIPWPFEMSSVTSEGGSIFAHMEPAQAASQGSKAGSAAAPHLILFAKGPGPAKLRFEAQLPLWVRLGAGERTLELPDLPFAGSLHLTLPPGVRLLAGSAAERSGDALKVAFDHRSYHDSESFLPPGTPRALRVRWIEAPPAIASQPLRFSDSASAEVSVTEASVATTLVFGVCVQSNTGRETEIAWPLTGKDAQVTDVTGTALRRWRQEGGKLFVTLERDGAMHDLTVKLRRMISSLADAAEPPLLQLNPPLHARVTFSLAPDLDFLNLSGARQVDSRTFEFQLGVDQPRLVLRTSKPRIESDVDVLARIDKDSVQIERKLTLRSDRPVTEVKVTLPPQEEFIAILSTPAGGTAPMLTTNGSQQLAVSNVASSPERLVTPNNISQPVFSERLITSNIVNNSTGSSSPFPLTWRRVGQTIALLPLRPIDPSTPLELSITSRLKLTKAWTGPRNPETVTLRQLDVPDAVKVAGYTALDFDDAWRVALKEAKGLEDRDARLTPVKGRMAWFGLREHSLTFEVERAEAVFSTEVTAYALPRARTIEIEGQFLLDISGAPLRTFQVQLPTANAKLLRVTSPLVGEQQLDEATGTWTYTLRQESKGRHTIRWRMSLPSTGAIPDPAPAPQNATTPPSLTATLPHLSLPQSRRFSGTWVIEANTDTQLSTKIQNMQPLDVLRVPVVIGYQPRHRITSAFTYGAGDSSLTVTAQRHAHSELAALVINRMTLTSVLGTDGHSLHQVQLDLSHSGEQFVSLHLPKGAELLSTSSGGQAVKPVRSVENAIAIPLPAGSANEPHTQVSLQYRQNVTAWSTSGTQNLEPIRLVGNVPVLSTDWAVHAPATFGYDAADTTLEQSHLLNDAAAPGLMPRLVSILGKPFQNIFERSYRYEKNVDFLPGGSGWVFDEHGVRVGHESPKRHHRIEETRRFMDRGDKLFSEGDYEESLGSYRTAMDSLPNAPETEDWLNLARLKFADCSVVVARERAKQGKFNEAQQLLQEAQRLVPGHKAAALALSNLKNPDRYPPIVQTDAVQVQRGLLLANSSVELGNYDAAMSQYQDVLRIDPYNSAARRGIENAERKRTAYFKTAYDHQRAKMLAQVNERWEDKVPVQRQVMPFGIVDVGGDRASSNQRSDLADKMNQIIFPSVNFNKATVEEALEYLRVKSRDLDHSSSGVKGVNIILRTGDAPTNAEISLDLKDIPMSEALRYVTELAQMKYKVEANAVMVTPIGEGTPELLTRSFPVPPDFLTQITPSSQGVLLPADPFAPTPPGAGQSPLQRTTARSGLEAIGITFPEGAAASYNPANSQLVVRNTQANLDLVEAYVSTIGGGLNPGLADRTASGVIEGRQLAPAADGFVGFEYGVGRSPGAYLTEKMNKIILPSVHFEGATIEEAIEYLRVKTRDLDTFAETSGSRGVNLIMRQGEAPSNTSISLDLKDVPLGEALRYVTELAQMKYKVEAHAVLIVPLSENASEQSFRTYRVPPDFLYAGGQGFKTARQVLEAAGILFPDGASASYNPATAQLVVRNTQPNLDLIETYVQSVSKSSGRLFANVDEMLFDGRLQAKSGLIPLDVTLPETGRLLHFHGAQAPETLALHYTAWSRQMFRAVLAMALGMALFWRWGRHRPWFLTFLVLILTAWAFPLLLPAPHLALANALTFGWLSALLLHLLGHLFSVGTTDTPVCRPAPRNLPGPQTALPLLLAFLSLATTLPAEDKQPSPDPAAHTVIIPYDVKQPLDSQKAERYYLGYDEFQRLWKLAKENRRALPPETDSTHEAVIHSALYKGRIEERGLVLEARITATSRGDWTKLQLPFAAPPTHALVGEVRVDGKSAALTDNAVTLEHPGTHSIDLTATLPLQSDWKSLTLSLPPALSGILSLSTPKSDGWLRINGAAASTVEEQPSARLFTQTLGTHHEVRLERSSRGLERGEAPVSSATVRGTLTLRELQPESFDAQIEYEFPGVVRRTLEFAVDEGALEIGAFDIRTTLPSAGIVPVPAMTTQTRREGGRIIFTITLLHEVSHGAVIHIQGAQRFLSAPGQRSLSLVHPLALRVKQDITLLHDDSMKLKVAAGSAQRSTSSQNQDLQDAGRWQWSGLTTPARLWQFTGPSSPTAPTYDVQPAALFAEADVSYVFQLTEQKAELLAALTLKRKRGLWTNAVVGLPAGYEVQAVQGPALMSWQHEGSQLYLQLHPGLAGAEARLVVHLARVSPQPVTTWTLEPLKLENYEKVGGKALIVAHAANEVKLPNPTHNSALKELDATVLDSVFAIAPPMEKKRGLQHEGTSWTLDVSLTRQPSRFTTETMLLVLASDAGIRISQQVVALVEQGAVRQLSIRLPASLPEAVVSGPLLRETRSHIENNERIYECSLQTEVLDRAELTFDLDLPLSSELDVPFVKVPEASRLTRWFVLDNASAREAKVTTQTALEPVARDSVPYLPASLLRPQFFRATGEGALKIAYQQLTSTEGNAALITLADLTTILRPDGTRWDVAQYSLINRSLQFLPVILPDHAELISVSVSGEPVRADEETQNGQRVRLIPLIHTRPGQRALEVKMIYRFAKSGKLQQTTKLDDPEVVGLSVERTTWTVWTPQGWSLKDFDGNMTSTAAEGRELLQLEGMLSELGEANRLLSSGKLDYREAEAAYRDANALAQVVQQKKAEILTKVRSRASVDIPRQDSVDTEVRQQQELLQGNWNSNYANGKGVAKNGRIEQGKTSWDFNNAAPQEQQIRLAGNNTFTGSVTTNGGQLFNDNVAVDNSYFAANGVPQQQQNGGTLVLSSANAYVGGTTVNAGGVLSINSLNPTASQNYGNFQSTALAQNANGSFNTVNSNARSNNLGNNAIVAFNQATATTTEEKRGEQMASGKPANSVLSMGKDMQSLPGGGAGVTLNSPPAISGTVNFYGRTDQPVAVANVAGIAGGWATADANADRGSLTLGAATTLGSQAVGTGALTQTASVPNTASSLTTNMAGSTTFGGVIAGTPVQQPQALQQALPMPKPEAQQPAAPAMGADPFGSPAEPAAVALRGADPFGAPGAGAKMPEARDAVEKAKAAPAAKEDDDGRAGGRPTTLAQTVESLRPTGRRALGIDLPLDGTAHHFSKLKDHAVLEVAIQRVGDPKTNSRLIGLTLGLLLWAGIGWKMKRRHTV